MMEAGLDQVLRELPPRDRGQLKNESMVIGLCIVRVEGELLGIMNSASG
jgi:hypothetical protein